MNKKYLLFVNLRRIPQEGLITLFSAKQLGYEIILLTNKQNLPDYVRGLVTDVRQVDTYNIESSIAAVKELASKYKICAVPSWTEADVELVARINETLKLPGLSTSAAYRARNKFAMKQALNKVPELLPKFKKVHSYRELIAAIDEIGLPAVIKPTGASGSKGIFELRNKEDLASAFAALQTITKPEFDPIFNQFGAELIVEEFLTGPEFSVEGMVFNNHIHIVGITDKWTTDPFHLEYQHIFPSRFSKSIQEDIKAKSTTIIQTLGLNNCAFHLEAKYTAQGYRFIEVAARPGGDYITSYLVPISLGINFYSELIRIALGQSPSLTPSKNYVSGVRFVMAKKEGILRGWKNFEKILHMPLVEHAFVEFDLNTKILLPPNDFVLPRIASFIMKHENYQVVKKSLGAVVALCDPIIDL
jgi:biotin carboxylase